MTVSQLPEAPPSADIQKVSSNVLQYIFDLETKVEESFGIGHVTATALVFCAIGFVLGWLF